MVPRATVNPDESCDEVMSVNKTFTAEQEKTTNAVKEVHSQKASFATKRKTVESMNVPSSSFDQALLKAKKNLKIIEAKSKISTVTSSKDQKHSHENKTHKIDDKGKIPGRRSTGNRAQERVYSKNCKEMHDKTHLRLQAKVFRDQTAVVTAERPLQVFPKEKNTTASNTAPKATSANPGIRPEQTLLEHKPTQKEFLSFPKTAVITPVHTKKQSLAPKLVLDSTSKKIGEGPKDRRPSSSNSNCFGQTLRSTKMKLKTTAALPKNSKKSTITNAAPMIKKTPGTKVYNEFNVKVKARAGTGEVGEADEESTPFNVSDRFLKNKMESQGTVTTGNIGNLRNKKNSISTFTKEIFPARKIDTTREAESPNADHKSKVKVEAKVGTSDSVKSCNKHKPSTTNSIFKAKMESQATMTTVISKVNKIDRPKQSTSAPTVQEPTSPEADFEFKVKETGTTQLHEESVPSNANGRVFEANERESQTVTAGVVDDKRKEIIVGPDTVEQEQGIGRSDNKACCTDVSSPPQTSPLRSTTTLVSNARDEKSLTVINGDVEQILAKLEESEKQRKRLEKLLYLNGVEIVDDIPYEEAKEQIKKISKRMDEIGGSNVTHPDKEEQHRLRKEYFLLEQDMQKYNSALTTSDQYQAEQEQLDQLWEEQNQAENREALQKIWRHMPVNIRHLSEAYLTKTSTPNGKQLPKPIIQKFMRSNVLMLLRTDPRDIERMHATALENLRATGLTLTERRALHEHLKVIGQAWKKNESSELVTKRKWEWYQMMKSNFKRNLDSYLEHVKEYGPPGKHATSRGNPKAGGCPLIGSQCPVMADLQIDYSGDFGYPDKPEFDMAHFKTQKQPTEDEVMQEGDNKPNGANSLYKTQRANLIKKHYKNMIHETKAKGSCEAMDSTMDMMEISMLKWVQSEMERQSGYTDGDFERKDLVTFSKAVNRVRRSLLIFFQRSGMVQTVANSHCPDDLRSSVECELSEEVYETAQEFFKYIMDRMAKWKAKDIGLLKEMELLNDTLEEFHGRNEETLERLGRQLQQRSRPFKSVENLMDEVKSKMKTKGSEEKEKRNLPHDDTSGSWKKERNNGRIGGHSGGHNGQQGALMAAIQARGKTRGVVKTSREGKNTGRGGLLAEIQARRGQVI